MHGSDLRTECFRLWVETGPDGKHRSMQAIADAKGVSKQTLINWAKQDRWKERRAKIKQKGAEKLDEELSIRKANLAKKIGKIRDSTIKDMHNMHASSLEGAAHAVVSLTKMEMQLVTPEEIPLDRIEFSKDVVPRVLTAIVEKLSDDEQLRAKIETMKEDLIRIATDDAIKFANENYKAG